ncbi:ATP-grasp domain-containing protein [Streptomyces sp. NPDC127098]|uniref:ATP-grasp domain-containing protein n=1 Tax=Streptomyces sp. NPDC127098 TaxID=3347137 RepID=UPI0036468251
MIGADPDTPDDPAPADLDLAPVAQLVARLGLHFVTVDLARRADGARRIVELGDGQVSDRPRTVPAEDLITALLSGHRGGAPARARAGRGPERGWFHGDHDA